MLTKSSLAIALSRLDVFDRPDLLSEQYPTDSEVAAEALWQAYMLGDIKGKSIIDLGAGTGILGIGALLLGARSCKFVEIEPEAVKTLRANLRGLGLKSRIIQSEINLFEGSADVVIQNPPFGTKTIHADRDFLIKAMASAPVVYSFHKAATQTFIEKIAEKNGFCETHCWQYAFPLKRTHNHHTRRIHKIDVRLHRLIRIL